MPRFLLSLAVLAIAVGCTREAAEPVVSNLSNEETVELRLQLLSEEEPADAKTVVEVRDALADTGEAPAEPTDVAVVGQIGGMPNPYGAETQPQFPWVDGQAVFFLVDPTTAAQFKNHQHAKGEECSFCMGKARDLVDTVAMVRLQDKAGEVVAARADELLGLAEGDSVIVTGTARNELGTLVINASGIHPRSPQAATPNQAPAAQRSDDAASQQAGEKESAGDA